MEKNSKNKSKNMTNDLALKFNEKSLFIQNFSCKYFLDSNYAGDLFLYHYERQGFQKWEFQIADLPGIYYIKNTITGLYFSSNECGDLFCNVLKPTSSYQRWKIHLTTEPDWYTIINLGNDLILTHNKINRIMLKDFDKKLLEKIENPFVFLLYAKKPEKR